MMLTNKSGRYPAVRIILCAFFLTLGLANTGYALGPDEPTPTERLTHALELLQQQRYDEAIEEMFQYLDAVADTRMPRMLKKAQDVRYRLAVILIDRNRQEEAIEVLKDYTTNQPAPHMRRAMKMLVACYFDTDMYEEAIKAAHEALEYNENPYVVAVDKTLEDDETFGDEEEAAEDLPYTQQELTMLHFVIGESMFNMGDLEECIEHFTYVTRYTKDEQRKGYSIMQMINAMIDLKGFDRIVAWVPELYKTPARYDIRVNLALLGAAAALYEAGEYDSALPLYRMIVPREELLEYQEKRLRQLRIDAGLPPDMGEELTPGEVLLFGQEDAERTAEDDVQWGWLVSDGPETEEDDDAEVPKEISELEALLTALRAMQPYEDHVNFQMAQLYKNVKRFWEAVRFYELVSAAETSMSTDDASIYGRSAYELVAVLADELNANFEAETYAYAYFEDHKEGLYPRLVAYILTRHYQRERDWASIEALKPYVDSFERSSNIDWTRFDTELYFMQGVAQLMQQHYTNAVDALNYVIEEFPGTDHEANALFWCGFSYLCLEDNEKAYDCFERYTRDFPGGTLLDEAYYQGGISLFGLDRLDEAKERFSYVIDSYGTNSTVYSDACIMRADILASEGGDSLDKAVVDYKNAFKHAGRVTQATQATFKMCDLFKADENVYGLSYIEEAVNLYLASWGDDDEADIAKALFWLGRVMIQQHRYEEAANSYFQAIVDYGGNLRQDGVDMMIPELVKICKGFLTDEQRENMKTRIQVKAQTSDSQTLSLRLRVVLSKLNDSEVELGKQLIAELPNLDNASPPVLSAICEASFAMNDYSRSEELLRIFKYKFEDSDYMRSAYKLRASGQLFNKNLDGALETIKAAQEEYGTDAQTAWAQLMKASILLDQAVVLSGNESLPREKLLEYSASELQRAQDQMKALDEEIAEARNKPDNLPAVERKLEEKEEIGARIAALESAAGGSSSDSEIRTLLAQCKIDHAREENKNVMGVPGWRGAPYAQATYQLGQVEELAGNLLAAHGFYQRTYYQYKGLADGHWGAEGYLSSARCLEALSEQPGLPAKEVEQYRQARINTLRAMLYDRYVNKLPQADMARELLGPSEVAVIEAFIASDTTTNIVVNIEEEKPKEIQPVDDVEDTADVGGGA